MENLPLLSIYHKVAVCGHKSPTRQGMATGYVSSATQQIYSRSSDYAAKTAQRLRGFNSASVMTTRLKQGSDYALLCHNSEVTTRFKKRIGYTNTTLALVGCLFRQKPASIQIFWLKIGLLILIFCIIFLYFFLIPKFIKICVYSKSYQ